MAQKIIAKIRLPVLSCVKQQFLWHNGLISMTTYGTVIKLNLPFNDLCLSEVYEASRILLLNMSLHFLRSMCHWKAFSTLRCFNLVLACLRALVYACRRVRVQARSNARMCICMQGLILSTHTSMQSECGYVNGCGLMLDSGKSSSLQRVVVDPN